MNMHDVGVLHRSQDSWGNWVTYRSAEGHAFNPHAIKNLGRAEALLRWIIEDAIESDDCDCVAVSALVHRKLLDEILESAHAWVKLPDNMHDCQTRRSIGPFRVKRFPAFESGIRERNGPGSRGHCRLDFL
jgi:hypothetical protein